MSDIFMEALSGELSKLAGRKVVGAAYRRVQELGRKARHQARVGAGLKGSTKLGEDLTPELKALEGRAKTMEKKPKLTVKPPKPLTPAPQVGNNQAKPMPSTGDKAIELKKVSSAPLLFGKILMAKLGEGITPVTTVPPAAVGGPQVTKPPKPLTPPPNVGKPAGTPMPSTGVPINPMNKQSAEAEAGKMVKAILEGGERPEGPYTDGQQIGVDDPRFGPGQGLKNLGDSKAPAFTDRFNPTDVPQAFKKKGMAPTPSKAIPKSSNPAYGTGCGTTCIGGKHGAGCGLRRK